MQQLHKSKHEKYSQLLVVLVGVFLLAPFLNSGVGNVLNGLLLLSTIIAVIKSLKLPRAIVAIYTAIACTAFGLDLLSSMGWTREFNRAFALLAQALFVLYLGGAAYWIGRDISRNREVTSDTVRGGISVYFLLGFVWSIFYSMAETLNADAFSQRLVTDSTSFLKALHFSFTTLTTLGYGDIVPVSDVALVLTNLEAIAGQMYSTIFIAILVGGYLSRQNREELRAVLRDRDS
ncbi:MAG: potassium channel family protein [Cyanobacteria bacterium J06639_1]